MESISETHRLMIEFELTEALKFNPLALREREELLACAWLGYLEAKKRYDPRKGVKFLSFARQRVRGAIFDGLADISPLGRSALRAIKRHVHLKSTLYTEPQHSMVSMSSEAHRDVLSSSLEGSSDHSEEQVEEGKLSDLPLSFMERYQEVYQLALITWAESLSHENAHDPSLPFEEQEEMAREQELLSKAFKKLLPSHQELITAVYDLRRVGDNATLYAERNHLHRSTVSRRHAAAVEELRREIVLEREQSNVQDPTSKTD